MLFRSDGPAVSGKGTVARRLASDLSIYYLETGLLYRAIGYVISLNKSKSDVLSGDIGRDSLYKYFSDISYEYAHGKAQILYKSDNITGFLRTKMIDWFSSHVSKDADVRNCLRRVQRDIGLKHDLATDGRDCGTVIFPHAEYKFFLTASLAERTNRLISDDSRKNLNYSFDDARRDILSRDISDITRTHSPLAPAADAIIINNSNISQEETYQLIKSYIKI